MADSWTEISFRNNDKQRQAAYRTGVCGYGGGEDATLRASPREEIRQKSLPKEES